MATRPNLKPSAKNTVESPMRSGLNGGRLRTGNVGNKGGGRTPRVLRYKSRALYEKWLQWALEQVVNGTADEALMMQIGNTAAKYGLGTTLTETDTEGNDVTVRVIRVPMSLHHDN